MGWISEGFNQGKQMGGGVPTLEVFKMCGCGISGRGLLVSGWWLDSMILKVFPNLTDSTVPLRLPHPSNPCIFWCSRGCRRCCHPHLYDLYDLYDFQSPPHPSGNSHPGRSGTFAGRRPSAPRCPRGFPRL